MGAAAELLVKFYASRISPLCSNTLCDMMFCSSDDTKHCNSKVTNTLIALHRVKVRPIVTSFIVSVNKCI